MSEYIELASKYGAYFGVGYVADGEVLFRKSDLIAYSESLRAKDKEELAASQLVVGQMQEALETLYDRYENGDQVTEDGDTDGCYMGKAVKLSEEEENQILRLIPSCLNDNGKSLHVSTDALREHDAKVLEEAATYLELNWTHYIDGTGKVIKTMAAEFTRKYAKLRATKKEN